MAHSAVGPIILFVLMFLLVGAIATISLMESNQCLEEGYDRNCSLQCVNDCKSLDKEYFKYDGGSIFSSTECWCKVNQTVEQIW